MQLSSGTLRANNLILDPNFTKIRELLLVKTQFSVLRSIHDSPPLEKGIYGLGSDPVCLDN